MNELHLYGWLTRDSDEILALKKDKNERDWYAESIQDSIWDIADSSWRYDNPGLGGRRSVINNAQIFVYATDKECDLDEAMTALVSKMDGAIFSDVGLEGYSEYTITGYYCKEFTIGGHDLDRELDKYIGKYIHFVISEV